MSCRPGRWGIGWLVAVVAVGVSGPAGLAAPAKDAPDSGEVKEAKQEAPAKPATYTVKKVPLRVEVSLDGVFEAQHTSEIVLRPQPPR